MKYFKSIVYSILLFFILFISVAAFLLTSTPGLYIAVKLINLKLPGKIHLNKLQGRLLDRATFAQLTYEDDTVNIELTNTSLSWELVSLLHPQLTINTFQADSLKIHTKSTPASAFTLPKLPLKLQINTLTIATVQIEQSQFKKLHLQANFDNTQWTISHLNTNYKKMHFSLQTTIQPQAPYRLSASFNFSPITPSKRGLKGNLKLSGDWELYQWVGQFKNPVRGTIHGTLKNGNEFSTQARFTTPVNAQWQFDARLNNHQLSATTLLHMPQGDINGHLLYDAQNSPRFSGEISSKTLVLSELNSSFSQVEFNTQFKGDSLQQITAQTNLSTRYMDNILHAIINYDQKHLDAKLLLGNNKVIVSGIPPYQWKASATLPQPSLLHPMLAGLKTTLSADATISGEQQGILVINISPGSYQPAAEDKTRPAISFQGGKLTANLSPESLKTKGEITIDQQKILNLSLLLPKFRLDKIPSPTQNLDGKLKLHINSLDFLQGLSPSIEHPKGQVNVSLTALGTLNKPIINGKLDLVDASVFLPKLNLILNPMQVTLTSQNKQWKTIGTITADGQTLTINGEGLFAPEMTGSINISGDNFPAMKTAEYTVNISPRLAIIFTPKGLAINGMIIIPRAQLKPISLSSAVDLSEDAVFVSDKPATITIPLNISTDMQLQMGQDVALDVQGLHGFLDGTLQIKQLPQSMPYAIGQLTVRDGKYNAYGQDLVIQQGLLQFTGGLINNPAIRLRAVRKFNNATQSFSGSNQLFDFNPENTQTLNFGNKTTVGIEVGGRISAIKIKLFSMPPTLSQADILSMIILGRPANQASKSGGQLLLTALSSMNLDSGTKGLQLIEQLKQSLGFDINVQNNPGFNQKTKQVSDNTTLVVGKSLSKRLYLSYNVDVFQRDSNMLTLKYLLNKFFSIQITASSAENGIDLLYTYSKDQHDEP